MNPCEECIVYALCKNKLELVCDPLWKWIFESGSIHGDRDRRIDIIAEVLPIIERIYFSNNKVLYAEFDREISNSEEYSHYDSL